MTKIKNKKAGTSFTVVMIIVALAFLLFTTPLFGKMIKSRDLLFFQLGVDEKCEATGEKLSYYETWISKLKKSSDEKTLTQKEWEDMAKLCAEFKQCFSQQYKPYSGICESLDKVDYKPDCKGEGETKLNDGSCICNAAMGFTSKKEPGKSYNPPCIKDQASVYIIDESVTQGNENEKGVCIGYYGIWYCAAQQSFFSGSDALCNELDIGYEKNPKGYYERAQHLFTSKSTDDYWITRKECLGYAQQEARTRSADFTEWMHYIVFYTSWPDAREDKYFDDVGYCIFKNQDALFVATDKRGLCNLKGQGYNLFFVLTKKGSRVVEKEISTHYSIEADKSGKDFTESQVKSQCNMWQAYDLTFIRGVQKERLPLLVCQSEINWLKTNRNLKGNYLTKETSKIDEENMCCYALKTDI